MLRLPVLFVRYEYVAGSALASKYVADSVTLDETTSYMQHLMLRCHLVYASTFVMC